MSRENSAAKTVLSAEYYGTESSSITRAPPWFCFVCHICLTARALKVSDMRLVRYASSAGAALVLALSAHAQPIGELGVFGPSCIVVRFSGVHSCGRTAVHACNSFDNNVGIVTVDSVPRGSEAAKIETACNFLPLRSLPQQTPVNSHSHFWYQGAAAYAPPPAT